MVSVLFGNNTLSPNLYLKCCTIMQYYFYINYIKKSIHMNDSNLHTLIGFCIGISTYLFFKKLKQIWSKNKNQRRFKGLKNRFNIPPKFDPSVREKN